MKILLLLVVFFVLFASDFSQARRRGCRRKTIKYVSTGTYKPGSLCWDIKSFKGFYASNGNLIARDGIGLAIFDTALNDGVGKELQILSSGDVQIVNATGNSVWSTGTGTYGQIGFSFSLSDGFIVMAPCAKGQVGCIRHPRFLGNHFGYQIVWRSAVVPRG